MRRAGRHCRSAPILSEAPIRQTASAAGTLHHRKVSKNSALRIVAMNCRKEQVAIAGNATPESIEAEIRAAKGANSKLSMECKL